MELAFIFVKKKKKTALSTYRIDFTFCLISSFLTKVIGRRPNLDHKYEPIRDQKKASS